MQGIRVQWPALFNLLQNLWPEMSNLYHCHCINWISVAISTLHCHYSGFIVKAKSDFLFHCHWCISWPEPHWNSSVVSTQVKWVPRAKEDLLDCNSICECKILICVVESWSFLWCRGQIRIYHHYTLAKVHIPRPILYSFFFLFGSQMKSFWAGTLLKQKNPKC